MNGDDRRYSTPIEMLQSNKQFDDAVAEAIRKAAPFYEAWPIMLRWLHENGITLFNGGDIGWRAMDQRPGHQGRGFPQAFNNLSEALTFALEHVKQHLQETEAARDE